MMIMKTITITGTAATVSLILITIYAAVTLILMVITGKILL